MEIASMNPWPLPKGFRFSPTELELVSHYLMNKAMGKPFEDPAKRFQELELYNYTPEELREKYGIQDEQVMYIFVKKVLKNPRGTRLRRRTSSNGQWYVCRQKKDIEYEGRLVGHRATLVYHTSEGRTKWLMHEYRLPKHMMLDEWLLCKVYLKGDEEIKTKTDVVLKPQASLRGPEYSSPFSASRATAGQYTAMISSKRDNQLIDSETNVPSYFWSVAVDLQFEEAESVASNAVIHTDDELIQWLDSELHIPSYFLSVPMDVLFGEAVMNSSSKESASTCAFPSRPPEYSSSSSAPQWTSEQSVAMIKTDSDGAI